MPHGRVIAFVLACLASSASQATARACPLRAEERPPIAAAPDLIAEPALDPIAFFARVVRRYRDLDVYQDRVDVEHVVHRDGRPTHRVETSLACTLRGDDVEVHSPSSQARKAVGLDRSDFGGAAVRSLRGRYSLWLAPHLALRSDVASEGAAGTRPWKFRPIAAEPFIHDGRSFVHVELTSDESGGEREPDRMALDVDAQTMLVERLHVEERLPDGARSTRRLRITPMIAESATGPHPPRVSTTTPKNEEEARDGSVVGASRPRAAAKPPPNDGPSSDQGQRTTAPPGRATTPQPPTGP